MRGIRTGTRRLTGQAIIQVDLPGATQGTWVVLGSRRVLEGKSGPIAGPFRQITDKIEGIDGIPGEGTLQAALSLLAECGIRLYEREASGKRKMYLAAPADALVPVSAVPDLL